MASSPAQPDSVRASTSSIGHLTGSIDSLLPFFVQDDPTRIRHVFAVMCNTKQQSTRARTHTWRAQSIGRSPSSTVFSQQPVTDRHLGHIYIHVLQRAKRVRVSSKCFFSQRPAGISSCASHPGGHGARPNSACRESSDIQVHHMRHIVDIVSHRSIDQQNQPSTQLPLPFLPLSPLRPPARRTLQEFSPLPHPASRRASSSAPLRWTGVERGSVRPPGLRLIPSVRPSEVTNPNSTCLDFCSRSLL